MSPAQDQVSASNKLKDKWALQMPYMNGIVEEPRHCAPPSPPNGITGDHGQDNRPFWDSPDRCAKNQSSSTTTKSQSNAESSSNGKRPPSPEEPKEGEEAEEDKQNNAEGEEEEEEEVENVDDDPLEDLNSEECNAIIDDVLQECPSEQNTPYINGVQNRRDIFANKDNKGKMVFLVDDTNKQQFAGRLRRYQRLLNSRATAWDKIAKEVDPLILSALLWSWLDLLREPVLNKNDLSIIVIRAEKPWEILKRLDNGTRYTTEYLVRFGSSTAAQIYHGSQRSPTPPGGIAHTPVPGHPGHPSPCRQGVEQAETRDSGSADAFHRRHLRHGDGEVNSNPPGL
ncbi:protein tyrosine phosphatase domain-containing protein 1 [Caerostris extrusa]|uniref:Protein tyrosine phosphatase domain-containing protein 1 n=1 Tax=Caerostris extrusa TaxID=172846 RepID=A0AAV4N1N8_CAEEX|nr:protein tyrosine phosphatase domain-containing protein 1 [Caerostris extrusa]